MTRQQKGALIRWRGTTRQERVAATQHAAQARWAGLTPEERKIERAKGFSGVQAIPLLTEEQRRERARENLRRFRAKQKAAKKSSES
jgi:hypothetical protein